MKPPKPISLEIIAKPEDFEPSCEKMKIIGTFNPGAIINDDKVVLMIRIAEAPIEEPEDEIWLPYVDVDNNDNSPFNIKFDKVDKKKLGEGAIGKKEVRLPNQTYRLRYISHQMIMDGKRKKGIFYPQYEHERFGIEDVRITKIDGKNFITYVTPHRTHGVSTCFAITENFEIFQRWPIGDTPRPQISSMKDVAIFSEKVNSTFQKDALGNPLKVYAALMRPNSFAEQKRPGIEVQYSPDLIHWGNPHAVTESREGEFSGTGSPMIKIGNMWVGIYHEVNPFTGEEFFPYTGRLFALDLNEPWKVLYNSDILIKPGEHGMKPGYRPNVVYPTAMLLGDEGTVGIYSGEDDTYASKKTYYLEDLLKFLKS